MRTSLVASRWRALILRELIAAARAAGLYTNLITSGIGLNEASACRRWLTQDSITSRSAFRIRAKKRRTGLRAQRRMRTRSNCRARFGRQKIAFTVNLVVHRQNLDHLEEMIAFIEQLNPERVEIAHTQYYGWALANRAALMPTRAQLDRAVAIVAEAEKRLAGRMRIDSVVPDYYAKYPKACMGGLGTKIDADQSVGQSFAVPCGGSAARMSFENVREKAAGMDLAGISIVSAISRRRVDAGTVPQLRSPRRRLRRLPVPGIPADGRRHSDRSCLFARAEAQHRRSRSAQRRIQALLGSMPLAAPRSCNCSSRTQRCGSTARIPNKTHRRTTAPLPADPHRNRTQVGGDVVVLAVQVAELDVQVHVGPDLAGDPAAKVIAELILAGVQEVAVDRQTAVVAVSPPEKKRIAGRPWNSAWNHRVCRNGGSNRGRTRRSRPSCCSREY